MCQCCRESRYIIASINRKRSPESSFFHVDWAAGFEKISPRRHPGIFFFEDANKLRFPIKRRGDPVDKTQERSNNASFFTIDARGFLGPLVALGVLCFSR